MFKIFGTEVSKKIAIEWILQCQTDYGWKLSVACSWAAIDTDEQIKETIEFWETNEETNTAERKFILDRILDSTNAE